MPTEELGPVRNALASHEASGSSVLLMLQPRLSQAETRGRGVALLSQPTFVSAPALRSHWSHRPGPLFPSFCLSMSKSLIQEKMLPLPQSPQGFA